MNRQQLRDKQLNKSMFDIPFSMRVSNCLCNMNIKTVGDLMNHMPDNVLKWRGMGMLSLLELRIAMVNLLGAKTFHTLPFGNYSFWDKLTIAKNPRCSIDGMAVVVSNVLGNIVIKGDQWPKLETRIQQSIQITKMIYQQLQEK